MYSSVTTNVDKLGLKANTRTKEGKDVGLRKLSTDVIFVVVDAVLVITAGGSPVGQWMRPSVTSFCPLSAGRGTS